MRDIDHDSEFRISRQAGPRPFVILRPNGEPAGSSKTMEGIEKILAILENPTRVER